MSSNSTECEVSEISQSIESQTLQKQSDDLMLFENFELVTNETEQAVFESADLKNNNERTHDVLNDKNLKSIFEQTLNDFNQIRAVDDIEDELRVSHYWRRWSEFKKIHTMWMIWLSNVSKILSYAVLCSWENSFLQVQISRIKIMKMLVRRESRHSRSLWERTRSSLTIKKRYRWLFRAIARRYVQYFQ